MDLVFELGDLLPRGLCDEIRATYEKDSRKAILADGPDIISGTFLGVSNFFDWTDACNAVDPYVKKARLKYEDHLDSIMIEKVPLQNLWHQGYTMESIKKINFTINEVKYPRHTCIIIFLNSSDSVFDFGYKKVKPEKGKCIVFPCIDYIKYNVEESSDERTILKTYLVRQ